MLDQKTQQFEGNTFEANDLAVAREAAGVSIELEILESANVGQHLTFPQPLRKTSLT